MSQRELLPEEEAVAILSATNEAEHSDIPIVATQDPELIRRWAQRHDAEPATGEATKSGPATVDVHDGGVGIRFNFPGMGRYRPIDWDEWFENLRKYDLVFVYERYSPDQTPSGRYRLVTMESLEKRAVRHYS